MNTSHEITQPSWRPWKIRLITPSYWRRNWDSMTCSRSCIFLEAELGLEPRWFCPQTESSICSRKVSHTLKPWMQWVSNNILCISDARRWHDSLVIVKFPHLNLKLMVNKSIFRKQRQNESIFRIAVHLAQTWRAVSVLCKGSFQTVLFPPAFSNRDPWNTSTVQPEFNLNGINW